MDTGRGRLLPGVATVAVGVALGVLTVVAARPGQLAVCATLAVLLQAGASGPVADLLAGARRRRPPSPTLPPGERPVTTIVRLGAEPMELARTTVAVAAAQGPTVVACVGDAVPGGLPDGVPAVVGPDRAVALRRAVDLVGTDAVLVVSARAVPRASDCRRAASLLDGSVGWVSGRSGILNRDAYGVEREEEVDDRLRHRAVAAGLVAWAPDATLVRTDLLRTRPVPADRASGAWLRDRAGEGWRGTVVDVPLTLRAAPVAADGYWPDRVARQRGAVADLADAAWRRGSGGWTRVLTLALLARALGGWAVLGWVALPAMVTAGFPVEVAPLPYVAAVVALLAVRPVLLRRSLGLAPSLRGDAVALLYAAPASILATGAAVSRRVRRPRHRVPTRPLVWLALLATVLAARGLLAYEPGTSASRWSVVLSLGLLGLLWAVAIRALVERTWARTGFRAPMDGPVTVVSGAARVTAGRLVDGSPRGLALWVPHGTVSPGDELEVRLGRSGPPLALTGVVAARRRGPALDLVGVELHPDGGALAAWGSLVVEAAAAAADGGAGGVPAGAVAEGAPPATRVGRWWDRLTAAVVLGLSGVVMAGLLAVLLGYLPLVVRSGSMEPTYRIGDVVLVDRVPAASVRPGQVVSRFDAPDAPESVTHRVRSVRRDDGRVTIVTRGDANDTDEVWTVPADRVVGRVAARLPLVGRPLALVRTGGALVAVAVSVVAVLAALVVATRGRRVRAVADVQAPTADQRLPAQPTTGT